MKLTRLPIPDVVALTPSKHEDSRGYFSETFRQAWFAEHVSNVSFVQENQSFSRGIGVIRGLHFQTDPFAQGKLVRCLAGSVFDVAVDIRTGSPTFAQWVAATVTAEAGNQLWIPAGFLHGFCTLTHDAVVAYKVTNYYSPDCDKGVSWDDADIGVSWPQVADSSQLSAKDAKQPALRTLPAYFHYQAGAF